MAEPFLRFEMTAKGFEEATRGIRRIKHRLRNLEPAMSQVANNLSSHTAQVFQTQGRHIGEAWRPLALSTRRARARRWGYYRRAPKGAGPSGPALIWARTLAESFQRGGFGHIRIPSDNGLRWGSRLPYAAAQNRRRTILGFRDDRQRRDVVLAPVRRWVMGFPRNRL